MKTIMIVSELPCKNCHKYEPNACVECFNINGKKEQVPENFAELKDLCKDIKCCYVGENYISVSERNISFLNDGQIRCNCYNITNKATPQQMWQIIKSLIGAE